MRKGVLMRKQLGRTALLGALALTAFTTRSASAEEKKIKVLIIDGQNNHNWRATTPHMKKVLEDCGRFTVTVATTPEMPRQPRKPKGNSEEEQATYKRALAEYQVNLANYRKTMANFRPDFTKYDVVLSNYNGDSWPKETQENLEKYVKSAKGGLVIVHAANNSFGGWKEYNRMIGMGWRGNNFGDRLIVDNEGQQVRVPKGKGPGAGHGAQHAFAIVVRDPDHPITKGMPREWLHAQDELYQGMRGPIENVHLLATAYADKKKGGPSSTNENEPMIWTITYGKGRVFHTPMGHDLTGMRCIGFITTLCRGTEWAATGKVTIPIPENFPTAKKTSSLSAK
jgi:type 1 glutamine amidotransferase